MKSLVLGTGGLRSAVMMALAQKEGEVEALFINHKQTNLAQDRAAFLNLCAHFDIPARVEYLRAPKAWIPFKLTLFVSYALVRAQELGCSIVYYGASRDDLLIESSEEYLTTFRHLARSIGVDENVVDLVIDAEAPLALLDTKRIIRVGSEPVYGAPWQLTYSCERGEKIHCGCCSHCRRRKAGFRANRRKDPAEYLREKK